MKDSYLVLWVAFSTATIEAAGIFTLTSVDTTRGGNISYYHNGVTSGGFAGVILGNYNGTNINPLFCVDLFTDIGYASYNSNPLTPRTVRHEERVARLYINRPSTVVSQDTWPCLPVGGLGHRT